MASVQKIAAGANWLAGWKRGLSGRVPGLLAVALALSIIAAAALSLNLTRLRESFAWVEHTNDTLRNSAAAERALLEAESGERGYLLTGEISYLDFIIGRWLRFLDCLNLWSSWFPRTQIRRNVLASVELGPSRLADALAILSTARSRQLTPAIERQLAQFMQPNCFCSMNDNEQSTGLLSWPPSSLRRWVFWPC